MNFLDRKGNMILDGDIVITTSKAPRAVRRRLGRIYRKITKNPKMPYVYILHTPGEYTKKLWKLDNYLASKLEVIGNAFEDPETWGRMYTLVYGRNLT